MVRPTLEIEELGELESERFWKQDLLREGVLAGALEDTQLDAAADGSPTVQDVLNVECDEFVLPESCPRARDRRM